MNAMGRIKAIVTVVTSTAVPCQRNVIRLITPNSARKSPKMLTNCAIHNVRKGLNFKIVFSVYVVAGGVVVSEEEGMSVSLSQERLFLLPPPKIHLRTNT